MSIFKKSNNYFSLSILSHKLQVVLLDSQGKRVISFAEASFDADLVQDGQVVNPEKLAPVISKLLKQTKITQKSVVVGIPEAKAFTKVIQIPKIKLDEIDEAVKWQAKSFLPTTLKESYFDWRIINSKSEPQYTILVVSVPKKIIDGYVATLKLLDLQPLSFETTSVTLARLIQDKKELNVITEIQANEAILTLCFGAQIRASSIVALTGKATDSDTSQLLDTLKKMVAFYEKKYQPETVAHIYLCGSAAGKSLKDQVAKLLDKPVDFCPLTVMNFNAQQTNTFATAVSLARRKIALPEDETTINLLPPKIQKQYQQTARAKSFKFALILASLAIWLIGLGSAGTFFLLQNQLNQLKASQSAQAQQLSLTAVTAQKIKTINQKSQQVITLAKLRTFPQDVVDQVLAAAPESVTLTSLDFNLEEQTIALSGMAKQRQDLLDFKRNLLASQRFASVIIPISSLEKEENLTFNLNFIVQEINEKN